jgi:hypothetical protein
MVRYIVSHDKLGKISIENNVECPGLNATLAYQDADNWQVTIEDEYRQHNMSNTWEVVLCVPKGKPWVLFEKSND